MQERGWHLQAIGLWCIFVIVLTAAVGLYGDGVVSKTTIDQNNVKLEFQRFFRVDAEMHVRIRTSSPNDIKMSFPVDYLSHFQITSIVPSPATSRFKESRIEYVFNGGDGAEISFYLVPKDFGSMNGSVTVNDELFVINHFIFPFVAIRV